MQIIRIRSAWENKWESASLDPYPLKPKITFKRDGTFKLTVFSDIHFGENPWDDWGPEQDRKSLLLMRKVLTEEKPDFAYALSVFRSFYLDDLALVSSMATS